MTRDEPRHIVKQCIAGLYVITPDEFDTTELIRKARLALQGGAAILQYRNKLAEAKLQLFQAQALRLLTQEFNAVFIINDDARLAAQVEADGVHLGEEDGGVTAARQLLGGQKIIGVSCYNQPLLASKAALQPIDYIAFGSFFPSPTKPDALKAQPDLLRWARQNLNMPVVAIGGITIDNAATLLEAGADALAVISAIFNADDIQLAAQQFSTLIKQGSA